MKIKSINKVLIVSVFIVCLYACQQPGGNSTGSEYMPDMGHSVAYEANYYSYYYHNTWGSEDEYYEYALPRKPVAGTVARGDKAGTAYNQYDRYGASEEERTRAMNEIVSNPAPLTKQGLAEGKELYNIFCSTCHGEKGDGAGYLVRDDGGMYPVQPANFLLDEFLVATDGRYYHSIIHGRNLMGAYKDKLSQEERWNVIHHIRTLQNKEYANNAIAMADLHTDSHSNEMHGDSHEGEMHESNSHGEDHGNEHDHDHEDGHHDTDHHEEHGQDHEEGHEHNHDDESHGEHHGDH